VKAVLHPVGVLLEIGLTVLAPLSFPMGANTLVNGRIENGTDKALYTMPVEEWNKKVFLKTIGSSMPRKPH